MKAEDGSGNPLEINASPPTNVGSRSHGRDCKPCNKFNPSRPDSCRHGDQCEFCHWSDHERPKHRGQRGRHALQRRQFLEQKERGEFTDELQQRFAELIDKIYRVPHEAVDKVKKKLANDSQRHKDEEARNKVFKVFASVGDEAHKKRPDSEKGRVRGTAQPEEDTSQLEQFIFADLDARCKWVVGTIHLMAKKRWEHIQSKSDAAKQKDDLELLAGDIDGLLQQLENIPKEVQCETSSGAPDPSTSSSSKATLGPEGASSSSSGPRHHQQIVDALGAKVQAEEPDLFNHTCDLAWNEVRSGRQALDEVCRDLKERLPHFEMLLEHWRSPYAPKDGADEDRELLLSLRTLKHVCLWVKQMCAKWDKEKEALLEKMWAADDLEELHQRLGESVTERSPAV